MCVILCDIMMCVDGYSNIPILTPKTVSKITIDKYTDCAKHLSNPYLSIGESSVKVVVEEDEEEECEKEEEANLRLLFFFFFFFISPKFHLSFPFLLCFHPLDASREMEEEEEG